MRVFEYVSYLLGELPDEEKGAVVAEIFRLRDEADADPTAGEAYRRFVRDFPAAFGLAERVD